MPVNRRTHEALRARYQSVVEERDDLKTELGQRVETCARLAQQLTETREQLGTQTSAGERDARRLLHLSEKARAALDAHCLVLQKSNEVMAADLRDRAEKDREASA